MSATHQIHTHRLPRADQITQRLLLEPRHPDRVQLASKQQPDQQVGVTTVGLTRSPDALGILLGAATTHSTRRFASSRASP